MPYFAKVKTFARRLCILPAAVVWLASNTAMEAQEGKAGEEAKKPLTLSERVLRPLAKEVIIDEALQGADAKNTVIQVNLTHQMMTVTVKGQTAVTCPVSTGRRTQPTRPDTHTVSGRSASLDPADYGHFVDKQGRIMVKGVYQSLDPPPAGLMFVGIRQTNALSLGEGAPRILAGHVRSTACTNGDIIVSEKVAQILFKKVPDGAKVLVTR